MKSLEVIVDFLAMKVPDAEAARDRCSFSVQRSLIFRTLRDDSIAIARSLMHGSTQIFSDPLCKRPVGVCMTRGSGWLTTFIALVRLGIPVVPLTEDLSDSESMTIRNRMIVSSLEPILVICDSYTPQSVINLCSAHSIPTLYLSDIRSPSIPSDQPISRLRDISRVPLAYLYTGGTTSGCKCVQVSHAMAMHEMEGYRRLLTTNSSGIVLQHSSTYWGATFLGQINIALALGACIVFADNSTDITPIVESERITIIGLVPSQLRALSGPCLSLRTIFTWGEKLPRNIAKKWVSPNTQVIELLVSTEYWLSLYAIDGSSEFSVLDSSNVKVKIVDNELLIGGNCVTPFGYTDETINSASFTMIDGDRFFKTKDLVRVTETGKLVFAGRADNLIKIGGEWKDLYSIETRLREVDGVEDVAVIPQTVSASSSKPAVIVVMSRGPMKKISTIRKIVNEEYIRLVFVNQLPRNVVTGKVDRPALAAHILTPRSDDSIAKLRRRKTCTTWIFLAGFLALYLVKVSSVLTLVLFPYIVSFFLCIPRKRFPLVQRILNWPALIGHIFWPLVLLAACPQYVSFSIACMGFWLRKKDFWWPIIFWFGVPRQMEKWIQSLFKPRPDAKERLAFTKQDSGHRADRAWLRGEDEFEKFSTIEFLDYEMDEIFNRMRELGGLRAIHEDPDNGSDLCNNITHVPSPLYEPLVTILEKNCDMIPRPISGTTSLSGLSSLVAVMLANSIRDVLGRSVIVSEILKCETVVDLVKCVEISPEKKIPESPLVENSTEKSSPKISFSYRCQLWGWGLPCMWLFEAPPGSYIHYKSLRQALSIMAERHPAFRAVPSDPKPLFYWMNDVFVTFGLVKWMMPSRLAPLMSFLGSKIFHGSAQVTTRENKKFYLGWNETVFRSRNDLKTYLSKGFHPPVTAEILTLEEPGTQRRNFLRLYLTHAFSDGSSVVPILEELNLIYDQIVRGEQVDAEKIPADGLRIQESRLRGALVNENFSHDDLYLFYNMDSAETLQDGFGETIILHESFVSVCHAAAARMNCSIDVLFLSAIVCAMARLDSCPPVIPLSLIVPLRDSPGGASEAVGFLADLRNIDVAIGDEKFASLLSVVQSVVEIRRNREWKIPDPFSSCDRVLVNIVPAANVSSEKFFKQELCIQQTPGKAFVGHMARPMELYLEQVARMQWTFRSRCRLSDWSEEKFSNFVYLFKQCVVEILVDPNQLVAIPLSRSHGS